MSISSQSCRTFIRPRALTLADILSFYTDLGFVKQLKDLGIHVLAIKDMAGKKLADTHHTSWFRGGLVNDFSHLLS